MYLQKKLYKAECATNAHTMQPSSLLLENFCF